MKSIHTNQAPAAIGPYSQAIEANGMVFASGQIPIDPATGQFVEGGIQEQTRQALTNARNILQAAGTDMSHVVKTTVYLSDIANFVPMNEIYAQFFSEPYPARSAVAVKDLPKGALVEVEVLAVKPAATGTTLAEKQTSGNENEACTECDTSKKKSQIKAGC